MRLAELSNRSGLSSPTIKYYLRLGLLAPGETESATWASYDEAHLRRLTLIRALTEVGGLTLDDVGQVLAAVDDETLSTHQTRGAVQWPLSPVPEPGPSPEATARVDALLARHGWDLDENSPHRQRLAASLDVLDDLDFPATDEILDSYAVALGPVAEAEVRRIAGDDLATAAEHVVIGTVLYEPVLLTMRRIAHEVASGRQR